MKVFPKLMKLHLLGLFGVNAAIKTHDPDKKRKAVFRVIGFGVIAVMLFSSMFTSFWGMGLFFTAAGRSESVLIMGVIAATAMMLMTCVVSGGTSIFGSKDHDLLLSMPLSRSVVVLYREYALYFYLLLFAAYTFLPAATAYAVLAAPPWWYYPAALVTFVVLPVPALVVGSAIGVFVAFLLARVRGKNTIKTVLYMLFFVGVMLIYTTDMSDSAFERAMDAVAGLANSVYPPAVWIGEALSGGSWLGAVLFLLSSVLLLWGFTAFAGRFFMKIHARISAVATRGKYRIRELHASSPSRAMFRKELRRFTSSAIYLTNTAAGIVLMLIASVALAVKGIPALSSFGVTADNLDSIVGVFPAVLTLFVSMSCTTACSISLEGRALTQLIALPIKGRDLVRGKVLVNLVLTVPAILVCGTLIAIFGGLSPLVAVMVYLVPLAYAPMSALAGLAINAAAPKLDWKNEQQVVKQGAAMGFSMLFAFVSSGIAILLTLIFGGLWCYIAIIAAAVIVSAVLYRRLSRRILTKLMKIEG